MLVAVLVLLLMVTSTGVVQVLLRDAANGGRQGGGEQRDLALRRRLLKDAFHGIDEAHAQHLIGLIQHQQRQAAELQSAAIHVIDDPAGRAHHHVHAAPQGVQLRLVALAAVDGQHVEALQMRGIAQKRLRHLQGQFAGRHQHQHLRFVPCRDRFCVSAGKRKCGGFAGAGLRLAQHVARRRAAPGWSAAWMGDGDS